jgi:hypothetical protein
MSHALFTFDDRSDAQRAVDALLSKGFPADAIVIHMKEATTLASATATATAETDEVITGGFLTSMYGLFEGLFARDGSSDHAKRYGLHLERGGAVVCVCAENEFRRVIADRVMDTAACQHRTLWNEMAPHEAA